MVGPDLKAYRQLHRLTVAYARQPAPEPGAVDAEEVALIARAARDSNVFHRRTTRPPAVEICLDDRVWTITPDPAGTGWLARPGALNTGGGTGFDTVAPLWLRRAADESTVPKRAWDRLLSGTPVNLGWGDNSPVAL